MSDQLLETTRQMAQCSCGRPVYFENSRCLSCGSAVGFDPLTGVLHSPDQTTDGLWTIGGGSRQVRRCANLTSAAACNWLMDASTPGELCASCVLTRTLPDLSTPANQARWLRIEMAKRRLVASLLELGLPVEGLIFDFLESGPESSHILTGHLDGVVTLNIEEADDATRERIRTEFREPYRTLLGHLRHEMGHFYWRRLVQPTLLLESFRSLFGDEREAYDVALRKHHSHGAAPNWESFFVSGYATAHPHEDWAETWAHYLHMREGLQSAKAMGIVIEDGRLIADPFPASALLDMEDPSNAEFLSSLQRWCALSVVVNELNRSMGQPDFYPFVLSRTVVQKLHFVHLAITGATVSSKEQLVTAA